MYSRKMRGFTLIEMLVALSIFLIVTAISFMSLRPAWLQARVNNAYNTTLGVLRQARQLSVDNRKTYLVTFNPVGTPAGTSAIQIQRIDAGVLGPVITTVALPSDIQYVNVAGIPNTNNATPDNMGTGGAAVEFDIGVNGGIANQIYFFPDGSARDVNNNINNGVVYIARPTELYSSRAITLFGAAGRTRGWRLYAPSGAGVPHWSQQ
jgi:prepilin-type N-terminal cleavage/methylation domain-containing protein